MLPNSKFLVVGARNCTSLIMQVIELSSTKWRSPPAPARPTPEPSSKKGDAASGLNTNATPFVPSDALLTETVYDMPVPQQPVSCAGEGMDGSDDQLLLSVFCFVVAEWDEFVGEDHPVEGYSSYGYVCRAAVTTWIP